MDQKLFRQKLIAAPILQYGSNLNFEWQVLNEVCIDQNKLITTHDQVLTVKASSHSYPGIRSGSNIYLQ